MNSINNIIKLQEKKIELLKELREAILYERCKYHLIHIDGVSILYDIKTKKEVKSGRNNIVKNYIESRKIDTSIIYTSSVFKDTKK